MNLEKIKAEWLRVVLMDDRQSKRAANPNGVRRLAGLVPEHAPDQVSLAQALATFAYEHRRRDLEPGAASIKVEQKFSEKSPTALAREARRSPVAWAACELYLRPERRFRFDNAAGQFKKVVDPVPEPIMKLMEDCFIGKVKCRSGYDDNTLRDDAIRFIVWCALDADIKATSKTDTPCACSIVANVTGVGYDSVAHIWGRRRHVATRGRYGR